MKWLRYLALLVAVSCVGCASDGGPVGTGISSAISGNIVDVETDTATARKRAAAPPLPPIRVSIDGLPNATTMADDAGNFVLSGAFDGAVTLRFTVPQYEVTQQLDVPAGSAVVLQDIELRPDGVGAQAARQLDFFGTVDLVDCTDGTLLIHERRAGGTQFLVHLDEQTSIENTAGTSQSCGAIRVGSTVAVEGSIAYATDRTITALVVTIAPAPPGPPRQQVEVEFLGIISALDCGAGFVVVDDSVQRTTVQLTARTLLRAASGAFTCRDLRLGDPVRGEGQIDLRMPGIIVATQLVVTGAPTTGRPLRFVGVVAAIDCAAGTLQVRDDETTVDVQLWSTTVITRRNGQALACTDIQPGNRVQGAGQIAADPPGTLDATQITVTRPGRGSSFAR
jgi:hypothetical protein